MTTLSTKINARPIPVPSLTILAKLPQLAKYAGALLLSLGCALTALAQGPAAVWQLSEEGPYNETALAASPTPSGGTVLASLPTEQHAEPKITLTRLNRHGQEEWHKEFVQPYLENIDALVLLANGDYLLAGRLKDPQLGPELRPWLFRFGSNGQQKGSTVLKDLVNLKGPLKAIPHPQTGVYLAGLGTFSNESKRPEGFVMHMTPDGRVLWKHKVMAQQMDGIGGLATKESTGGSTIALVVNYRTSSSGKGKVRLYTLQHKRLQWMHDYGGNKAIEAQMVDFLPDGTLALAGIVHPGDYENTDAWVMKLDANGDTEWSRSIGGSHQEDAVAVMPLHGGGLVVAANTSPQHRRRGPAQLTAFDNHGTELWHKDLTNSSTPQELAGGYLNADGSLVLYGKQYTRSTRWDAWGTKLSFHANAVRSYTEDHLTEWSKRGEFEKTAEYRLRTMGERMQAKANAYMEEALANLARQMNAMEHFTLGRYDADQELFPVTSPEAGTVYIHVPHNEANRIKAAWDQAVVEDVSYGLQNNLLTVEDLEISVLGKTYEYHASEGGQGGSETPVDIDGVLDNVGGEVKPVAVSQLEKNIPVTSQRQPNTYALVIGNSAYDRYGGKVDKNGVERFAAADADLVGTYMNKTLGVPNSNIILLQNATAAQMRQGIEKLVRLATLKNGNAELLVYFAGKGVLDDNTGEAYLLPVDVRENSPKHGAISQRQLLTALTLVPSKSVTVLLDANHSGLTPEAQTPEYRGSKGGIFIKPKKHLLNGHIMVFASGTGTQEALTHVAQGHSLFTYHWLKALKDSRGRMSYGNLFATVEHDVQEAAILLHHHEQVPSVHVSPALLDTWRRLAVR